MWEHTEIKNATMAIQDRNKNQFIPGKFLHLVLNVSPTGDMAITMCKLLEHLLMKYCQILSRDGENPFAVASDRTWKSIKSIYIYTKQ